MASKLLTSLSSFCQRLLFTLGLLIACCDDGIAAEGCDPLVEKAHQAKATARVAYDVAVTETLIQKPDSTLAMTCFNKLAGINSSGAASGGGGIFSGDFTTQSPSGNPGGLQASVQDALQTFYNQYIDAQGMDSGLVDYSQTNLFNDPVCTESEDLWTAVKTAGPGDGVPNATITDLINGTMPQGASNDYAKNWNTSQSVDNNFGALQGALAAQPVPSMPTFGQNDTFCQQLITAGVPGAACP